MNYCSFDRFEGMWLGSIISAAIASDKNLSEQPLVQYLSSNWMLSRNEIAQLLIKAEKLEVGYISEQLVAIVSNNSNFVLADVAVNQKQIVSLLEYQNILLPLLPLVIFWGDNQDLLTAIITQCNLNTTHAMEIKEDVLIWSYLLALVSKQQLDSQTLNVRLIVKQILAGVKVETSSLIQKLEIVSQGWEQGITWQQLTERLLTTGNWGQIAIALAVYCFGSTPQDFWLSSKRAANLDQNLAALTTALTATISGAYNGMTGIPGSWRTIKLPRVTSGEAIANQHQTYQQAQSIGRELWKSWLGIYSDNEKLLYDQQLHAVALPNIIQPRKTLKIISQKLYL
ncbi:MAG: ADP-ribosylglycohydrolase family protein [Waterburya sp.]